LSCWPSRDVGHQPGAGERAAELFLERVGSLSITVYPTVVMDHEGVTHDAGSAARIARFLTGEGLAGSAGVARGEVDLSSSRAGTQWKVFKRGRKQLAGHLKSDPVETDYAMVVHLLVTPTRSGAIAVGGIQVYLLDGTGRDAHSFLLNAHHDLFSEAGLRATGPDAAAELRGRATDAVIEAFRAQLVG
jgi:hypothetical protein